MKIAAEQIIDLAVTVCGVNPRSEPNTVTNISYGLVLVNKTSA